MHGSYRPYEPDLVYAYPTGVFSYRNIERRLREDLALRMLAAGNFPRHRTICDFRAFRLKELSPLFVQVLRLAREMGSGEPCTTPQARSLRGFCRADPWMPSSRKKTSA